MVKNAVLRSLAVCLLCLAALVSALFAGQGSAMAAQTVPTVVSMGDSYSSGEGTPPFYDQDLGDDDKHKSLDWLAHRSKLGWPGQLVVNGVTLSAIKNSGWYYVAASGAETKHLMKEPQEKEWKTLFASDKVDLPCQLDVFSERKLTGKVDYVTLTIGGNDLGFADILTTAATEMGFINRGATAARIDDSLKKYEYVTRASLLETYSTIGNAAGQQAKIVVAGYPHLLPSKGRGLFSREEARVINAAVDTFDNDVAAMIGVETSDSVTFADVRGEFIGHEEAYINDVMPLKQSQDIDSTGFVSAYSMHPNSDGQRAYARAVQKVIDNLQESDSASKKSASSTVPANADEQTDAVEAASLSMSLVFDVSGSMDDPSAMGSTTKLQSAVRQASDFVSSLQSQVSRGELSATVGVGAFSTDAFTVCAPTSDLSEVVNDLGSLAATNMTNIHAGLSEGINQLEGQDGEKLMVLLSDGLDNMGNSFSDMHSLAERAADMGIRIFTIGFGSASEVDETLLSDIASTTGGEYAREDASNVSSATVGLFGNMLKAQLSTTSQVLMDANGSVRQGETVSAGGFTLDNVGTIKAYLYWPGSELEMVFVDPDGTTVDESYPGYVIDDSTIPSTVRIDGAKAGDWELSVYGEDVSMDEEPFYAIAAYDEMTIPVGGGGGGASNGGESMMLILLVVAVGCILTVYALSRRDERS